MIILRPAAANGNSGGTKSGKATKCGSLNTRRSSSIERVSTVPFIACECVVGLGEVLRSFFKTLTLEQSWKV
jgi:hypothetical protein